MKSLPHGRDPLSLLGQDDAAPTERVNKNEPQLMDPLGLVDLRRDHLKEKSSRIVTPVPTSVSVDALQSDAQDFNDFNNEAESGRAESGRLTSQDSGSLGGHLFSEMSLKSIKNRLQGTVNAIQGSASAALSEIIRPLNLNGQVTPYSEELSAILNIDSYDFEKEQPFSSEDLERLIQLHPEYELLTKKIPLSSINDRWFGEDDPMLIAQGVMTLSNSAPTDHIGVKIYLSNLRIILLPVQRLPPSAVVATNTSLAETVSADLNAEDRAAYAKTITHYFIEEGLVFIMRGHMASCNIERLMVKKSSGAAESAMTDALALDSESLVGACLTMQLLTDKSVRIVISTNQGDLVDMMKDQIARQFQCFDPHTFRPEFSAPSQSERDDDLMYLGSLQIFAFFDPVKCYKDWGGLIDGNANYQLCESYPPFLPLGGLDLSAAQLAEVAKFRSRGRLPILSHRTADASMWRCSQPQTSVLGRRCESDEWLIRCGLHQQIAQQSDPSAHCVHIYDARPFANALANKIGGAGYESTSRYVGCTVDFASIENIHKVSGSFASLKEALQKNLDIPRTEILRHTDKLVCSKAVSDILPKIYQTGWFDHILALLKASYQIANLLNRKETVLVHCSDGWDRTAQLTFLSLIFLCPAYRTVEGFCLLLEKEFAWLGHMLNIRLGLGTTAGLVPQSNDASYHHHHVDQKAGGHHHHSSSKCPIILQLLECTFNILKQAPNEFEFNERFLLALAHHIYAKIWGDFAFNNHRERINVRRTFSWRSLFQQLKEHCPDSFRSAGDFKGADQTTSERLISFDLCPLKLSLWDKYWLRHCTSFF